MKQWIGGYQIDMVTEGEVHNAMHRALGSHFEHELEERYRGIKYMRRTVVANLDASGNYAPNYADGPGPASGYVWAIQSLTFYSTAATLGTATVYRGDTTDASAFAVFTAIGTQTAGRLGWLLYSDERLILSVGGGTANGVEYLTVEAIEVPGEMLAKVLG